MALSSSQSGFHFLPAQSAFPLATVLFSPSSHSEFQFLLASFAFPCAKPWFATRHAWMALPHPCGRLCLAIPI